MARLTPFDPAYSDLTAIECEGLEPWQGSSDTAAAADIDIIRPLVALYIAFLCLFVLSVIGGNAVWGWFVAGIILRLMVAYLRQTEE